MNLGIEGKKVIITGASQGIGLEIAELFSLEGASVTIISSNEKKLDKAFKTINKKSKKIKHFKILADLTNDYKLNVAIEKILKNKVPDIIIHNVGGTLQVKSPLASYKDWLKVININVGVAIKINNKIVPYMKKRESGKIVHISSISSQSLRGSAPYAASKTFLNAYVQTLARDLATSGIVVSAVLPGAIHSKGGYWDIVKKTNPKKMHDFLRHHHAIGRLGKAKEIAPWVLFLCSKYSTFSVGTLINVDGGTM
jgi:3-oxoacyl-[acyl-carrier protein] reductase